LSFKADHVQNIMCETVHATRRGVGVKKRALCTPTLEKENPTDKHLELYTR